MTENEKKRGFWGKIKHGLYNVSQIISIIIIPEIKEGTENILNNVENKMERVERKITRNLVSLLVIGLGGIFLIFALFFFLIENLSLTKTTAFFLIGITIFMIGILLKLSTQMND